MKNVWTQALSMSVVTFLGLGTAVANPRPNSPGAHTLLAEMGIPVGNRHVDPAEAVPPYAEPEATPTGVLVQAPVSEAPPADVVTPTEGTLDARPQALGLKQLAPAGTTNGSEASQVNATPDIENAPKSPTPRGFPLGAPGGSYAPAGPSPSGPEPGFRMTP